MNKILALIVSSAAVATVAFASEPAKPSNSQMSWSGGKWAIRVFYGFAQGDMDDINIDSVFGGALEYSLPNVGTSMTGQLHFGLEYSTTDEGTLGSTITNYGLYAGYAFPLGQDATMPFEAILRAGYFNSAIDSDIGDDDDWGFGFDIGLRYRVQKFYIEAFYASRPELNDGNINWFGIGINFPIGN
jgi:opacity protein-like surface antigen